MASIFAWMKPSDFFSHLRRQEPRVFFLKHLQVQTPGHPLPSTKAQALIFRPVAAQTLRHLDLVLACEAADWVSDLATQRG